MFLKNHYLKEKSLGTNLFDLYQKETVLRHKTTPQ